MRAGRRVGAVLDRVAGQLHEGVLERGPQRGELVHGERLGGGQLADVGRGHPGDDDGAVVVDGRAGPDPVQRADEALRRRA